MFKFKNESALLTEPVRHLQMQELFVDPVLAPDGHTYERSAIVQHMQTSAVSPITGEMFANTDLIPNHTVASLLRNRFRT